MDLKEKIRDIPDFPQKGILFRDITPLLRDPLALDCVVDRFHQYYRDKNIQVVAAIEARGYILGSPLALRLGAGFVPVRKPGKLPYKTISQEYSLEYGVNTLEIHADAVNKGERVLILDDLIATGGSAAATSRLVEKLGGVVAGFGFMIELTFLKGREVLKGHDVYTIIQY
ncbi:MAG: adenine phosphoribosyltransferase [Armatimonadetes bacterium]|nr:adenine phosphoribosyltransferase [Armatimonadota bacterium]